MSAIEVVNNPGVPIVWRVQCRIQRSGKEAVDLQWPSLAILKKRGYLETTAQTFNRAIRRVVEEFQATRRRAGSAARQ
jgi:hypothetical protein